MSAGTGTRSASRASPGEGVHLLGRPRTVERGRLLLDDTVGANTAAGDRASAEVKARIDAAIRDRGLVAPAPDLDPADAPHPDPAGVRSPAGLDLDRAGIGSIVLATGFTAALGFPPPSWLDVGGQPAHERGEGAVPGLVIVGWRWMISRRSSLVFGADRDGGLAADAVARHLAAAGRR